MNLQQLNNSFPNGTDIRSTYEDELAAEEATVQYNLAFGTKQTDEQMYQITNAKSFGQWLEESWEDTGFTRYQILEGQFDKQQRFNSFDAYVNSEWTWYLEREHRACENGVDI